MAIIISVRKIGNGFFMSLPISLCRKEGICHGDYFKIEKDAITNLYYLEKIGNDNGNVNK